MAEEFAPMNLRARLAALHDRITQARTQLEANGVATDEAETLTGFVDQHDAIRDSLDAEGTVTELQHSRAAAQTDALEADIHRWIENVERTYKHPPSQKPEASF